MIISKNTSLFLLGLFSAFVFALLVGTKLSYIHAMQEPPLIPLRDFFRNPEKTGYKLSPDGTYLSFLASFKNRLNIFVQKIGTEAVKRITAIEDKDIHEHFWKNNDLLMYLMDNNGDENFHLFGVSKDGSMLKDFTPFQGVQVSIVDWLEDDQNHILIKMNRRNKKVFDVYRLNLQTGNLEEIAQNPGDIIQWLTDHEGKLRIAVRLDGVNRSILYRDSENELFRPILTTNFKDEAWPVFFTFDNKQLYLVSNINRDKKAVVIFDPITQQETDLIYEHPDFDVASIHFSRKRKVLTDVEYVSWKHERVYLDSQTEALFKTSEHAFKKFEIYHEAHDADENKYIILTFDDRSPGVYYLFDCVSDTITKLSDVAPWLPGEHLAPTKAISYVSRDGIKINGYLTLPLGTKHKNLPVVVNPHGGPWSRNHWTASPEKHFLANRGYAVLQVNFRGSTGYGKKFVELSFKQWGKAMQDDISDGVKWLIDSGIADPKRIAIYGGSYGGYATLVGMTCTPDLYACGVDYCGMSSLFTMVESCPEYWKPLLDVLYERIGHPEKDKELFTQISPIYHVDKIIAPLFIAQGRTDPRVNIKHSDQIVAALKEKGVEVEYMVKDNEGHGFNNEENKFDFYEAMEKFLAKYLKQ